MTNNNTITITHIFDAPRELVWRAWTEPEFVMRWWGPRDYTSPACTIDLRVGGKNLFSMRSPEGKVFWSTGTYRELVPMEKIVMTDSFADEHGNVVSPTEYGFAADFPPELLVTITFEEMNGKTKLTLTHEGLPEGEMSAQTQAGWEESFEKLAKIVKTKKE